MTGNEIPLPFLESLGIHVAALRIAAKSLREVTSGPETEDETVLELLAQGAVVLEACDEAALQQLFDSMPSPTAVMDRAVALQQEQTA